MCYSKAVTDSKNLGHKRSGSMFFPANLMVALFAALIYIFIAFKLPGKYKNSFRLYSIFIQASFVFFLIIYQLFISTRIDNSNLYIYSYGLDIFYVLIMLPFLSLLIYYISKWFINIEGFSTFIKYLILFIILAFLIFLAAIGYVLFIFIHYGFAP